MNIERDIFQGLLKDIPFVTDEKGEPWWVAEPVCNVLGLHVSSVGRLPLDAQDMALIDTPSGPRQTLMISEPGLYSLLMESDHPKALSFMRSIFKLLPQIPKPLEIAAFLEELDLPGPSTKPHPPSISQACGDALHRVMDPRKKNDGPSTEPGGTKLTDDQATSKTKTRNVFHLNFLDRCCKEDEHLG
jgi:hypothetical protein